MNTPRYLLAYRSHHDSGEIVRWHHHTAWQMEICFHGRVTVSLGKTETINLTQGNILMIFPHIIHQVTYLDTSPTLTGVIKFDYSMESPPKPPSQGILLQGKILSILFGVFQEILPEEGEPDSDTRHLIEGLLFTFFHTHFHSTPTSTSLSISKPQRLFSAVQEYLKGKEFQHITISQIAKTFGYSPGYLSALFRQYTGQSLQQYLLDQKLQGVIRLLKFSDESIPKIATQLNFPDLASFSRFIRRSTGISPRILRQRLRAGEDLLSSFKGSFQQ